MNEKICCSFCKTNAASFWCHDHEVALCIKCDEFVHESKHQRMSLKGSTYPNCALCNTNAASLRCQDHEFALCITCDEFIHESKHQRMSLKRYTLLKESLTMNITKDDLRSSYYYSRIVFVDPKDSTDPRAQVELKPAPRLFDSDIPEHFGSVSFLGLAGSGKSLIIRSLIQFFTTVRLQDNVHMPLPGPPDSFHSTTSDICMYSGDADGIDLIYFDSEGINGTEMPNHLKDYPFDSRDEEKNYFETRQKHINVSYPRLLYHFSDVICFVFPGSTWGHRAIFDSLLKWAEQGATGSCNKAVKPYLIIIMNKLTLDEYKKTAGLCSKFFNSASAEYQSLSKYFTGIKVIFMPDAARLPAQFVKQLEFLKKVMLDNVFVKQCAEQNASIRLNKQQFSQYIRSAIDLFNVNQNASFDIVSISLKLRPLASNIKDHIVEFFRIMVDVQIKSQQKMKNQKTNRHINAYQTAIDNINIRMKDIPFLSLIRSNDFKMPIGPGASLPEKWKHILEILQIELERLQPCKSSKIFQNFEVYCENLKGYHGSMHQSSKSYKEQIDDKTGSNAPCWWDGDFETSLSNMPNFLDTASSALEQMDQWNKEYILKAHSDWLDKLNMHSLFSNRTCLGCLLNIPTEEICCGHMLCYACMMESQKLNELNCRFCPLCKKEVLWKTKTLLVRQGYRILALDGGGIRVILEVMLLQEIEKRLQLPIVSLFDFIIGTSGGGIIALALTILKDGKAKSVKECMDLVRTFGEVAFSKKKALLPMPLIATIYFYKSKYGQKPLQELLKSHFGNATLFHDTRIMPKVAVTTCKNIENFPAALFTSYNRTENTRRIPIVPDMDKYTAVDVALATSAAATYFKPYTVNSMEFTDGGMQNNNPAEVGLLEAQELWPNSQCDLLLSLGSGKSNGKKVESLIGTVEQVVNIATSGDKIWKERVIPWFYHNPELAVRLNLEIPENIKLDDYRKLNNLQQYAQKYIETEGQRQLDDVCNRLFASLFYAKINEEDIEFDIKMQICSRVELSPALCTILQGYDMKSIFNIQVYNQHYVPILCSYDWLAPEKICPSFELPVIIKGLTKHRQHVTVEITLNARLQACQDDLKLLISGCPFTLNKNKQVQTINTLSVTTRTGA